MTKFTLPAGTVIANGVTVVKETEVSTALKRDEFASELVASNNGAWLKFLETKENGKLVKYDVMGNRCEFDEPADEPVQEEKKEEKKKAK